MVGIDGPFPGQFLQRLEATSARNDGMASGSVRVFRVGEDDEVLQEPEGLDRRLDLGVGRRLEAAFEHGRQERARLAKVIRHGRVAALVSHIERNEANKEPLP